jgi:glycosyltransferase involved in cell wall biosynthesis
MSKKKITVIIPVYMNEGSIYKTYVNVTGVLKNLGNSFDYEITFINDGSTDNSLQEIESIEKIDQKVSIVNFTRNFGQVSAVLAGFEFSESDLLINISADMQDPPELIEQMIEKWEEGYKVVACERIGREDSFIAKITSKIFYQLIKISIPKMPVGGFDYFLLDREVYKKIFDMSEHNSFMQGDILWLGYEPCFIKYTRRKRQFGKSQWTLWKKLKYFIDGLIYTSYLPIRLMSMLGLITSFLGFLYALAVVAAYFLNETPFTGYAPIMIVLLVVSGLIMFMLGIIGEYLWRTYDQVRRRPRYIIKNKQQV